MKKGCLIRILLVMFSTKKGLKNMTQKSKKNVYTDVFKLEVLRDLYSSGQSVYSVARKWQVDANNLHRWKKNWPVGSSELSLSSETIQKYQMTRTTPEKTNEELLQERITALEQALYLEKMRSRAFEKMIEIAEAEEGISILKKGGARQ